MVVVMILIASLMKHDIGYAILISDIQQIITTAYLHDDILAANWMVCMLANI
jgi:hypothetical protein